MHPILFELPNFPVRSFGVMLMIGFVVAIVMASRRAKRFGLTDQVVQDASIWIILLGVLFARVLFIAQEWKSYAGRWDQIFKLQMDGLTSFGGLLGGAIGVVLVSRAKKFRASQLLDTVGVPMLVASAIGRVGCLLNGCCFGHACPTSPPGIKMYNANGTVYTDAAGNMFFLPAQLLDSALVLIGALLITWLERSKKLPSGMSVSLVMIAYGMARFFYEFLRAGTSSTTIGGSGITEGHIAALLLALVGAVAAYVVSAKAKKSPTVSA